MQIKNSFCLNLTHFYLLFIINYSLFIIIHQHFAFLAIEGKAENFTRTKAQKTGLLIWSIRIYLAAMPEFKQQAVLAGHQMIVLRLHSFKMLIGIK